MEIIYGGYGEPRMMKFDTGEAIEETILKGAANKAIGAIASELPEELQTQQAITYVLKMAKQELKTKRLILSGMNVHIL